MTMQPQLQPLAGGFNRRGACPALSAPMQTGDGLLVRLNPVAGGLSPKTLIGLCNAALTHGNGIVEVTARGSLQIRGLTRRSAANLACDVDALGIAVRTGVPVQTGALAGLDPDEIADPSGLAESIRAGIVAMGLDARLGPKVSVVIDGGGRSALDEVSADVRLTAVALGIWQVAMAGDAETAKIVANVDQRDAAAVAIAILSAIAENGVSARARDLTADAFLEIQTGLVQPSVLPDISPARGEISQSPTPKLPISPLAGGPKDGPRQAARPRASGRTEGGGKQHDAGGDETLLAIFPLTSSLFALGVSLPFGHTSAETLAAFARRAEYLRVSDIRLAPKRTILALCPNKAAAQALKTVAEELNFITSPTDPRQMISACPGAPACASGHISARDIAADIAADFEGIHETSIHISGCAKGCAHPDQADITVVGSENGAGIVVAGTARDVPLAYTARDDANRALRAVAGLLRAGAQEPPSRIFDASKIAKVFGNS